MTRDVNFRMSGPYIMTIRNEHVQNYRQETAIKQKIINPISRVVVSNSLKVNLF